MTHTPVDLIEIERLARSFHPDTPGAHDWDHTARVVALARRLALAEGADLDIVIAAALLHDIGRVEENESQGKICHATEGARIAEHMLRTSGYTEQWILKVSHCIATHRFRGGDIPHSLEARILFDADKLDAIGAVGIGRAFQFAGEVGARLHDPNVVVEHTQSYSRDDTAYREYLVKLQRVHEAMLTPTGKKIADERHTFMVAFFDRLNAETRGDM